MTKVIQASAWYLPDQIGGTEVYVDGLARALQARGIESVVAAPGASESDGCYRDIPVHRYAVPPPRNIRQIRGEEPHDGFGEFVSWLRSQKADIYHQHSWTFGCGPDHLLAARELGLRTVLTVHVPGLICLKGTMILLDRSVCDGRIEAIRCATCWGASRGLPEPLSRLAGRLPSAWSAWFRRSLPPGRLSTALARRSLVESHRERVLRAAGAADRIVAVCQWLREALLVNGLPADKVSVCRQGVVDAHRYQRDDRPSSTGKLRVGYLGRWSRVKGIHVLVEALRAAPSEASIELTIHATGEEEPRGYREQVVKSAQGDPRIHFAGPVSREDVPGVLSSFDLLAVPSQWLETGPYVVLEAFAAGTPTLGSDQGGIRELVSHGADGWLVPPADRAAWTEALCRFARDRDLLQKLRGGLGEVRTMEDAASETATLYAGLTP